MPKLLSKDGSVRQKRTNLETKDQAAAESGTAKGSNTVSEVPPVAEDEEDLCEQLRNNIDGESGKYATSFRIFKRHELSKCSFSQDLLNMEIPPMPEPVMSSDGSGQRLMIESIEVENFKSYYGRQVIGPFHQNFTSIIGPNGSGKSNVIDSLLFVFGYRAAKLRSAKLSVLIHSSASHENLQSCSVAVNFQKIIDLQDGGFKVVPGSQFKVSRTAYKDNSSKYFYNGKAMQFKDVAKLLRQVGIDLIHNRFLILQGEVEQIAMMKPKSQTENDYGMLEYLEDIIGSSRLKVPLEKLSVKIEELQEARTSQLVKVKYAEKEKDSAEQPVIELMAEIRTDNAIVLAKNQLYSVDEWNATRNLQKQEQEKETLVGEFEEVKARQKEVAAAQKEKKQDNLKLQRAYEAAQKNFEHLKSKISEMEQAAKKRKIEKIRLQEKVKKLSDEMKKEEKKISDLEKVPENALKKIEEFRETLSGIEEVIAGKQAEVDKYMAVFEEETVDFQNKKKASEEKLGKLIVREDEACSKLTLAQEALQLLRMEEEKERTKVANLQTSLNDAVELLQTKKKDFENVSKAIPNLEEQLKSRKAELAEVRRKEPACVEAVRNLRNKYERKKQTVEAFKSQNNLLNRLMREKKSGKIPGIFGRLGDLGAIDQKYDVAISTTCGALDYIVVDTIDTAQQCVDFLKKENLGIATFIALDKQAHLRRYMEKPASTPEQVPRLFDLIRVADPNVLPAFYYALRETLVANDITTATRIGLEGAKRHRVVTLKGEVVEASGLMAGGGRAEKRGRIGQNIKVDTSKVSSNEMDELEKQLTDKQEELTDLRRTLQQVESRLNSLQADYDRLKRTSGSLENEIGPLEQKVEALKRNLEEQKEKAKNAAVDDAAVQEAKATVARLSEERDTATEAADEVRQSVAEFTDRIQEVYDRVVGQASKDLNELKTRKETASKGISKEQAALNNAQRNMNKSKARKIDLESDYNEAENALVQLENDESNFSEEVSSVEEDKKAAEEKMLEAETVLEEARARNVELDGEDVELKKKFDDYTRNLKEQDHALELAKSKLSSIKNKIGDLDIPVQKEAIVQSSELPRYTQEEVEHFDTEEIGFNIRNLEKRKVAKGINMNDLSEYLTKLDRYDHEMDILNTISLNRDRHRQLYQKLRKQRMTEFMEGFTQIGVLLKEMYQMITLGGNASLDLVDSLDPFSEGVSFGYVASTSESVRPPKKSWKQISNLSGGEKTLASLALVFALHHYRPTPLYIMDEIDAALDFRNVSIIGHYVKERTKNAQFIIISLRNNMFELADRLIGIYKTFDCTKNVSIDPHAVKKKMLLCRSVVEESRQHSQLIEESQATGGVFGFGDPLKTWSYTVGRNFRDSLSFFRVMVVCLLRFCRSVAFVTVELFYCSKTHVTLEDRKFGCLKLKGTLE
ncbi:unnamed protein product [Enterobius vermicularis]|uniref:Structural maintenance of chromosomes protein n=1 Tax=Enterobius vermicularis TaxID=51028 RepID=A0A0N4V256_ENTVE|nr:unnamed protein product [Enterobius vermicularis]